jgi:hypothetical protein
VLVPKHPLLIRGCPLCCCCLQDIRTAMSLLSSAPAVNLELWSQLSRAAGLQGQWQLARECATAALGALPAGKRDLQAVSAAADVPEVSPQGWYWLAVAEMQQGQVSQSSAVAILKRQVLLWALWSMLCTSTGHSCTVQACTRGCLKRHNQNSTTCWTVRYVPSTHNITLIPLALCCRLPRPS